MSHGAVPHEDEGERGQRRKQFVRYLGHVTALVEEAVARLVDVPG